MEVTQWLAVILKVLGMIFASFVFWRKLKEDYPSEKIFKLTILMALMALLLGKVVFAVFAAVGSGEDWWKLIWRIGGFNFPALFLGGVLGMILFSRKADLNAWQVADAAMFPFLGLFLVWTVAGFLNRFSFRFPFDLFSLVLVVIAWGLVVIIHRRYRSFAWYKSGKTGFIACFSTAAFFSLFLLLDIFLPTTLYWQLCFDVFLVGSSLVLLYRRSERKLAEDRQQIKNFFKRKHE